MLIESHGSRHESTESRVVTLGGSDPGSGLQVTIEDGSEVDLHLKEGGTMTTVGARIERRPPMSVKSSNSEIQNNVYFTGTANKSVVDSGCPLTVSGSLWYSAFRDSLRTPRKRK